MSAMRVSVVVPVYNGERFLIESLESALQQSYPELEIIAVNDGSTDGTGRILNGYASKITVLEQPNRGHGAALNAGVARSTGSYIAFLDADDIWDPYKIERQVDLLERFPSAMGTYCDHRRIDEQGKVVGVTGALGQSRVSGDVLASLIAGNFIISPSAVVLRREAFYEAGAVEEKNPELGSKDYGLWLRLAVLGPIVYQAETLLSYRVHENSMSGAMGYRRILSDLQAVRDLGPAIDQYADSAVRRQYQERLFELHMGAAWYYRLQGHRHLALKMYREAGRHSGFWRRPWVKMFLVAVCPSGLLRYLRGGAGP